MNIVKKYFIDFLYYSIDDNRIYGDMGYTFCDMPESMCDTLADAMRNAAENIEEQYDYFKEDNEVPIYEIWEYSFDTDKFDEYNDFSVYSDAFVSKRQAFAVCPNIESELFSKILKVWKGCGIDVATNVEEKLN